MILQFSSSLIRTSIHPYQYFHSRVSGLRGLSELCHFEKGEVGDEGDEEAREEESRPVRF